MISFQSRFCAKDITAKCLSILCFICFWTLPSFGQQARNAIHGKVMDAVTMQPVFGVNVGRENNGRSSTTNADGSFVIIIGDNSYNLTFSHKDYKALKLSGVRRGIEINDDMIVLLNRKSFNLSAGDATAGEDSAVIQDTVVTSTPVTTFTQLSHLPVYSHAVIYRSSADRISTSAIRSGRDLDAAMVVTRLQQVSVAPDVSSPFFSSLLVGGFNDRYNQILLDGSQRNSTSTASRTFAFSLLPSEALDNVSIDRAGSVSRPLDYAGGSVNLQTRATTDQNFFYVLAGAGFSDQSTGNDFYGEGRGHYEHFGFPGRERATPGGFPIARSEFYLNSQNIQEQVYQSRQLKNNLGPKQQKYFPDTKLLVGFGHNWKFHKKNVLSIVGYLQTLRATQIQDGILQTGPNVSANPFPFNSNSPVVFGLANDKIYSFSSASVGVLNGTYTFGNNMISFRTFGGSTFQNNFHSRTGVNKPGEDTLAHYAVSYFTDQQIFINASLNGDHALGARHLLHLKWLAGYSYTDHQNPDERNILLRQSATNPGLVEIATPLSTVATGDGTFTNSSRQWRTYREHLFNVDFSLSFPFTLFHTMNVLEGGVFVQSQSRIFYNDVFNVQGTGYTSLQDVFDPTRYFPGGLTLTNYYQHATYPGGSLNFPVTIKQKGNYTASSTTGASFLEVRGKFTPALAYRFGLRGQIMSNLVSNIDFQYFEGFKNPQNTAISENVNVQKLVALPSAQLRYEFPYHFSLQANYFESYLSAQFQEMGEYRYYNGQNFTAYTGNSFLKQSKARNSAAALSFVPDALTNLSVGGFYKIFDAPVENYVLNYNLNDRQIAPYNSPYAAAYGFEANVKRSFRLTGARHHYSVLTFSGSGSVNRSDVDAGPVKALTILYPKHQLSGLADAVATASIVISGDHFPEVGLQYNYNGNLIVANGSGSIVKLANGNSIQAVPDYRLAPTHRLGARISQKFLRESLQLSAGVQNLLATDYVLYQDLNGNEKFDASLKVTDTPKPGYFLSGTDNTVQKIKGQRTWFFSIAYQIH